MHAPAGRHRALDGDGGFQVDAGLLGRGVDRRRAGCEMIEPGAGLVAERPPEIPDRPVTGGIAAEKRHLDHVIRHIGMGDALFREQQVVQVIVVDDHRALGPQELHPVGLAERRVAGWQGIAHPEIITAPSAKVTIAQVTSWAPYPAARNIPCCPRATTSTGRLPSRNQHSRSTYEVSTSSTGVAWGSRLRIANACAREL